MSTLSTERDVVDSSAKPGPRVLDHEYDGIREYDNPTPGWWHLIFVATVFFSVFYIVFWDISPVTPTIHEAWSEHQAAEYRKLFGELGELKPDEPTLLSMMSNEKLLEVARGIFEGNCAACHAKDGGGINGANLTDEHFKNVKSLTDIYAIITDGANSGAMPAWRNRLSDNERIITAAFVANLRGTTPKNPGPALGERIPPWPKPQPTQPK